MKRCTVCRAAHMRFGRSIERRLFFHSYVDSTHQQFVQRIITEEYPEASVSCIYEVLPEFREYDRLSTTVFNAYIGTVMASYLERLGPELREVGISAHPHINQSNCGVISFDIASTQPVRTVLSGPSSGIVGAN